MMLITLFTHMHNIDDLGRIQTRTCYIMLFSTLWRQQKILRPINDSDRPYVGIHIHTHKLTYIYIHNTYICRICVCSTHKAPIPHNRPTGYIHIHTHKHTYIHIHNIHIRRICVCSTHKAPIPRSRPMSTFSLASSANLCVYVCIHVCMYSCMYTYITAAQRLHSLSHPQLMYKCVCVCVCVCMYLCMYTYITAVQRLTGTHSLASSANHQNPYVCACMYVYVYIYLQSTIKFIFFYCPNIPVASTFRAFSQRLVTSESTCTSFLGTCASYKSEFLIPSILRARHIGIYRRSSVTRGLLRGSSHQNLMIRGLDSIFE